MRLSAVRYAGILLLGMLILSAGCSSVSPPPGTAGTTTTLGPVASPTSAGQATFPVATPATTETPAIITPATGQTPALSLTPTWVYPTYDATGDPRIIVLEFRKEYFNADLPDCGMRASFPEAAADPAYGISGRNGKLVAYTEDQMRVFLRENAIKTTNEIRADRFITDYIDPATLGGPACSGTVSTPTWNFVLINATIMGRNARQSGYAIGFNVRSKGNVVAQIRADRNLTLDEPAIFALYVPLKTTETELFDGVEMVFARQG
jgi:hypothetical protein